MRRVFTTVLLLCLALFQCDFFGKTIFSEHFKRESVVFHAVGLYCFSFINVKLIFPEEKQRLLTYLNLLLGFIAIPVGLFIKGTLRLMQI